MYSRLDKAEEIIGTSEAWTIPYMIELNRGSSAISYDTNIYVQIPDLGIQLHQGLLYSRGWGSSDYEVDAAITVIREINSTSVDTFIYFEDDGFAVSLHNYLNCSGSNRPDLTDKEAILFINDGGKWSKVGL